MQYDTVHYDDEQEFLDQLDQFGDEQVMKVNNPMDEEHDDAPKEQIIWDNPDQDDNENDNDNTPFHQDDEPEAKFNVTKFEGALAQIGTGKIFESDKEKMAWMEFDIGSKPPTKNKPKQKDKEKPKQKPKKKSDLPFAFNDEEVLSKDKVFDVKKSTGSHANMSLDKLKQLYLLPRIYQIEKQQ